MAPVNWRKPPETMATRAPRAHCPRERFGAGVQRNAVSQHFVDHALRQAGKEGDALAQRRFEGNLPAHRPLGDGGDMRADPGVGRQFVDAFLADEGRIPPAARSCGKKC